MSERTVNTELLDTSTDIAYLQATDTAHIDRIDMCDVTVVVAGNNPSNITFVDGDVDTDEDTITETAHGFTTGMKITELTTTGTLPAGLALSTVYYAIVVDADTIKLATSQANALAGTAVNITAAAGGGTHTVSVETTLAGNVKLQKNNEPRDKTAVWVDIDDDEVTNDTNQRTISAAATFNWALPNMAAREIRAYVTITSGTVTAQTRLHGKGQ